MILRADVSNTTLPDYGETRKCERSADLYRGRLDANVGTQLPLHPYVKMPRQFDLLRSARLRRCPPLSAKAMAWALEPAAIRPGLVQINLTVQLGL